MLKEVQSKELNNRILEFIYAKSEERIVLIENLLSLYTEDNISVLNTSEFKFSPEIQCELLQHPKAIELLPLIKSPASLNCKNSPINESLFLKKNKKVLDSYLHLISKLKDKNQEKELNNLYLIVLKNKDFDWLDFYLTKIEEYGLQSVHIEPSNIISIFSYTFIDDLEYVTILRESHPSNEIDYLILAKTENNQLISLIIDEVKTMERCIELIEALENDKKTFILQNNPDSKKEKVKRLILRYENIKLNSIINECSTIKSHLNEDISTVKKKRI